MEDYPITSVSLWPYKNYIIIHDTAIISKLHCLFLKWEGGYYQILRSRPKISMASLRLQLPSLKWSPLAISIHFRMFWEMTVPSFNCNNGEKKNNFSSEEIYYKLIYWNALGELWRLGEDLWETHRDSDRSCKRWEQTKSYCCKIFLRMLLLVASAVDNWSHTWICLSLRWPRQGC